MKKIVAGIIACLVMGSSMAAVASDRTGESNFILQSLSGKTYKLSDYRDKQPVLLFFWTTWCPYCLKKLQFLNQEYVNIEKDGVVLLAVNVGERRSAVERLVRNYKIAYNVLLDEDSVATDGYHILGVPTFILIDKSGVILYKGNEYPQGKIQQLIGS
jgi:peroxiredoxin